MGTWCRLTHVMYMYQWLFRLNISTIFKTTFVCCILCTRVIFAHVFFALLHLQMVLLFLEFAQILELIYLKKILNLPRIKFALWQCWEKGNNKAWTNISLFSGIHRQHVFWYVIKHVLYRRNTWRKNSPIREATCLSQSVACKFQHVSACF